jgi:hypothetical protein
VLRLPKGNGTGRFTRVATALSVNRKKGRMLGSWQEEGDMAFA